MCSADTCSATEKERKMFARSCCQTIGWSAFSENEKDRSDSIRSTRAVGAADAPPVRRRARCNVHVLVFRPAAIVVVALLVFFGGAIVAYRKSREDVRKFHRMAEGEDDD